MLDTVVLKGSGIFDGIDEERLRHILANARPARFERAAHIFREGADAASFYLLLDGYVRVVRTTPDGEQIIMRFIPSGELFGIAPALGHLTYPADAVAAVDCVTLVWPSSYWSSLVGTCPELQPRIYALVGRRLEYTQERLMEIATERVEHRVASVLLKLTEQTGRKTAEGVEIDFPLSRQDISEMTGSTLHTVSRLLSAWELEGLVKSGRQKVIVTSPRQLSEKMKALQD